MTNVLLLLGLAVTPFILAPGNEDIAREPKMAWAVVFSLVIGLYSLHKGLLKPFRNKWAFVLAGFALVAFYMSPNPELKFFGIHSGRFWSWEPLFYILTFLLFTVSVASMEFTEKKLKQVLDVMMWCGCLMAGLVLLQFWGLDQFFEHRFGTFGHMAGTLGNPTLVGPFLVLVIPIALYRREKLLVILMIAATVATRSDVALIGMAAMGLCYLALKGKKWFITITAVTVLVVGLVGSAYVMVPTFRQYCPDNERFLTWTQSVNDIKTPVMRGSKKIYAITGIGPGSFMYLFHAKNNQRNDNFVYAHNDYVQVMYELGIVGFLLFISMLGLMLKQVTGFKNMLLGKIPKLKRALIASLAGIAVCAMGCFVWQIGTTIFYSLVIVGLLYNHSLWPITEGEPHAL